MTRGSASIPRIDLCVLLAGGLKPSPLAAAAGRSVLDLSADGQRTVLEHWIAHLAGVLAPGDAPAGQPPLPVRILHGSSLAPTPPASGTIPRGMDLTIERETKEFRGPAGVVKDAAEHLPPDATVLVIEAARWFGGDLPAVIRAHMAQSSGGSGDGSGAGPSGPTAVTVAADRDNAPAGIVVLQRSTLDLISQLGFMDLKEQWLGKLAEMGRSVRVFDLGDAPSIPLRERTGLLAAARAATGSASCRSESLRALYADSDEGHFAAVSPHSRIGPNTSIVDSVIMDGAEVGEGAIVARSVVCPGAIVAPSEVVVDQVRAGRRAGRAEDIGVPAPAEARRRGTAPEESGLRPQAARGERSG